jgi:hypothetical protein
VTDPLPACIASKKGRHALSVILPDTSELPAVLFCEACGATKQVTLTALPPADDIIAAVERIVGTDADRG